MDNKQEHQQKYYKEIAGEYDKKFKRASSNHYHKIERIEDVIFNQPLSKRDKLSILEIGGGTGIHAEHVLQNYGKKISKYVLSDLSGPMLEQAKIRLAKFKDVEYAVVAAENMRALPQFDIIFLSGAMHHFSDPRQSLVEIKKHLNVSGSLIICEPIVSNPLNFIRACLTLREDIGQFTVTHKRVRSLLKSLGYCIVSDSVLHIRFGHKYLQRLYPHEFFERTPLLNWFGSMFLIGAVLNNSKNRKSAKS